MKKIYKGNFIDCPTIGQLRVLENHYIETQDGVITDISDKPILGEEIVDFKNTIVIPGLCDMHLHAPQYANRGFGLDLPLLPWLETYTFPEEKKYKDEEYAKKLYPFLVKDVIKNGTTKACFFSSIHLNSSKILCDVIEQSGMRAFVGKVNMDRNSPDFLVETTDQSIDDTLNFVEATKKHKNVKPIITPRFVPSCSKKLMQELGNIANRHNVPVQSHLSENLNEIKWVKELEPETDSYCEVYEKYGLVGDNVRSIMAHCVSCSEQELLMLKKYNVLVAHCPESNANISSGIAPVFDMLSRGISVALGSDIAAGTSLSVLDAAALAVRVSKLRRALFSENNIDFKVALYLATSAGQLFFGEQPGFAKGNLFDAVVIDDSNFAASDSIGFEQRVGRIVFLSGERNITSVYANGQRIFEK